MRLLNSIRPKVCLLAMTLTSVILLLTTIAFSAEDKLVLYYKFDKIAKDKVIDHSGTGNDGTIVGNVKEANGNRRTKRLCGRS